MKWSITDQFHEYLYGNTFDVYTDNNPLTYVLTTAKLDAMGHRWITGLANYNFHIHYKSGKSNVEADALSWIDREKCVETIQAKSIQAIVVAAIAGNVANHIEAVPCSPQTHDSLLPPIPDTPTISKAITRSSRQSHPTQSDWVEAQSKDKTIGEIIQLFKAKELQCQKGKETHNKEMRQFIRQQNRLFVRDRILYHKNESQEVNCLDRNTMQLVIPKAFRKQALQGCHNDLGHLGVERKTDLLRDNFYWPGMIDNITRHVKHCKRCWGFKALPEKAPMENIDATYPMELVHMDYLTIETNEGGKDVHIFVITDHFT